MGWVGPRRRADPGGSRPRRVAVREPADQRLQPRTTRSISHMPAATICLATCLAALGSGCPASGPSPCVSDCTPGRARPTVVASWPESDALEVELCVERRCASCIEVQAEASYPLCYSDELPTVTNTPTRLELDPAGPDTQRFTVRTAITMPGCQLADWQDAETLSRELRFRWRECDSPDPTYPNFEDVEIGVVLVR